MKKSTLFLSLIYLFSSYTSAQVIATEPFDYPLQEHLENQGNSGQGWAGSWTQLAGSGNDQAAVLGDALPLAPLGQQTHPNLVRLRSAGPLVRYQRLFETPVVAADGPVWFSVAVACGRNDLEVAGSVGLVDLSRADFRALRISVGKHFGQTLAVADGTALYPRSLEAVLEQGSWLVAALYPVTADQWRAYVWANPDPTAMPDTAQAIVRGLPVSAAGFDGVWLQSAGGPMSSFLVDDVRTGRDFTAVRPDDWETYVPPEVDQPREPFAYPTDSPLSGLDGGAGFAGPWRKVTGQEYTIADESFPVNDTLTTEPALLKLDFNNSGGNVRYVRQFAAPFNPGFTEYWFGANLSIAYTELGNVAQLFLAQSNNFGSSGPAGQLFQIGKAFNIAQFTLGQPGNYERVMGRPADNEYFVVVRVTPNGPLARYDLWLNPDPTQTPPDADIRGTIELPLPAGGWDGVGVKVEGNVGVNLRVDDIGLGPQYVDAVPPYWRGTSGTTTGRIDGLDNASLFPNPSRGVVPQLRLEASRRLACSLSIFDAKGRRVAPLQTITISAGQQNIALPSSTLHLPPGPYRIILQTNRGLQVIPWIKID